MLAHFIFDSHSLCVAIVSGERRLHRTRRHLIRPDRHQHRWQVPGKVRPQHASTFGHQGL